MKAKTEQCMRNITRFTTKKYTYNGWRLSISRGGYSFTRYYADREYGSPEAALKVAKAKRKEIFKRLAESFDNNIATLKELRAIQGHIIKRLAEEERKNVLMERGKI